MARTELGFAFSIALWSAGCGSPMSRLDEWCADHVCDADPMAFTTDDAHVDVLSVALDNINAASGLELRVDSAGSPVRFMPVVMGEDAKPICGATLVMMRGRVVGSVDVDVSTEVDGCTPQWATIRHEIMCHALSQGSHTETGVCSVNGAAYQRIDDLSLDAMCLAQGC